MSDLTQISSTKYVQWLDASVEELPDRKLVGGKAWSLARMASLGLNVPPAFVVTTEGFREYERNGALTEDLRGEILEGVRHLEELTGRTFGAGPKALLLSVRSGAAISMPGMMDTVLNLGMSDQVEAALAAESGDPRFALDTHKRFQDMFLDIVFKLDPRDYNQGGTPSQTRAACEEVLPDFSWGSTEQLFAAVEAVFRSWNSRRARKYRSHQQIPHDLGTAVTIQAMVFGNLDQRSATGVLFSRNPHDGSARMFGEYLRCAQGEDVVSGRVTPEPLDDLLVHNPGLYQEISSASEILERANREVQDIEFTVQHGVLYLLQSRNAMLAAEAMFRTSVDLVNEGVLTRREAIARLTPAQAQTLVAPQLSYATEAKNSIVSGESACAGVGIGQTVTDSDEAVALAGQGKSVVLVRSTTSPEDLPGMLVANAIVTEQGGSTSHAAVVSRALGVPCVVGCGSGAQAQLENKVVTVDATSGSVFSGILPVETPDIADSSYVHTVMDWCTSEIPFEISPSFEDVSRENVLNLDEVSGGTDPECVGDVIRARDAKLYAITGGALVTPQAIEAAMSSNVTHIIADPVLPVLILAAKTAGRRAGL